MVNLLKGRKNLEKAPALPRFTTTDDAQSKFKKLVRYYNKVMDISTVDLDNILEGIEGDYQWYRHKPENYSGYKKYDLDLNQIPENAYKNVVTILRSRAKIDEFDFAFVKVLMDKEQDQVFAIVPRLAYSKESAFYGMHNKNGYHFVGFNSVGYILLKSKIAELKKEKGYDFESAVNHIAFVEHNFVLNQKYSRQSSATIATVQSDKKYQDSELNKSTIFNQLGFRKVEVDTQKYEGKEFDYNLFRKVEEDFEEICNKLPHASAQPELKFRKLGKHKATGLNGYVIERIKLADYEKESVDEIIDKLYSENFTSKNIGEFNYVDDVAGNVDDMESFIKYRNNRKCEDISNLNFSIKESYYIETHHTDIGYYPNFYVGLEAK